MTLPIWIKPGVWGVVVGSILTMIVGFAFVLLIAATPVQVPQDHAAATQAHATSIR